MGQELALFSGKLRFPCEPPVTKAESFTFFAGGCKVIVIPQGKCYFFVDQERGSRGNRIVDKINQLSTGEKLIAGGGIVMLIASFLPWYRVSFLGFSVSVNGWEAPGAVFSILAVIISVALAGIVLATKFGNVKLPDLGSITWGQAFLGAGIAVLVLVIIKFLNESSSLSIGFYLGFLASVAIAAGGYLMYSEEKALVTR